MISLFLYGINFAIGTKNIKPLYSNMAKEKGTNFLRLRLSISQKIIGGFLAIILIFNINGIFSVISITENASIIQQSSEVDNPSLEEIQTFRLLLTQSKMYITNWVYNHNSQDDKDALRKLQDADYPELKDRLVKLMGNWDSENQNMTMDTIFVTFEKILKKQKKIMNELVSFEDYENTKIKFPAEKALTTEILPTTRLLLVKLDVIFRQKKDEIELAKNKLLVSFNWLRNVTLGLGAILIVVGLIAAFLISRNIIRPIKYINDVFVKLGSGELPLDEHRIFDDDEVGQMADAADKLVNGLRATSLFAENIGKGNYQASYTPLSAKDVLGNALIEMRNNLATVAEEDRRRNWQNEGIALFGSLLQKFNNNIEELSDNIISNLVKYTKANQGGLFIVQDSKSNGHAADPYMELASCYAWDKKKYLEQKVYLGDGLAGQAWQENATIHVTEVPQDYVMITSGLGESNPNDILIAPLKYNEEVFGVLELASFHKFQPYEIIFVEKIAENIASSISALKINERTKKLLEESTEITEQMKSKEEEVKRNMIELQQTKEEIERKQRGQKEREALVNTTTVVIETDRNFNIIFANKLSEAKLKYRLIEFDGMSFEYLFESYPVYDKMKNSLHQSYKWSDFVYLKDKNNKNIKIKLSAASVLNSSGIVEKYIFLLHDINETEI